MYMIKKWTSAKLCIFNVPYLLKSLRDYKCILYTKKKLNSPVHFCDSSTPVKPEKRQILVKKNHFHKALFSSSQFIYTRGIGYFTSATKQNKSTC